MAFSVFSLSILTELMLKRLEEFSVEHKLHEYTPLGPTVLAMSVLLFIMIVLGVIYGVFWEEWNFVQSLYFTMVTISTVGYGDYAPSKSIHRLVISFYTLFAGGTFAAIVSFTIAGYIQMRKRAVSVHFLFTQLTPERLREMPTDENRRIGRKEFLEYMLINMGYVDALTMNMINDCFETMDSDGSGFLTVDDVVSAEEAQEFLKYMRKRHGIEEDDSTVLPVGIFGLRLTFQRQPPAMSEERHRRKLAKKREKGRMKAKQQQKQIAQAKTEE